MEPDPLELLEARIETLEKRVLPSNKQIPPTSVIDQLLHTDLQMTVALKSRDSVNAIFQHLPRLNEYLNPTFANDTSLDTDAKEAYILTLDGNIRQCVDEMQRMESLKAVLESPSINIAELKKQQAALNGSYLAIKSDQDEFLANVEVLLKNYCEIMGVMKEHLTGLGLRISQFEGKK